MVHPLWTPADHAAQDLPEADERAKKVQEKTDGPGGRTGYSVGRRNAALGPSSPHPEHEKGPLSSSLHMIENAATSSRMRVLYTTDRIHDRVREMGLALARDYQGLDPILVGVLKGACA